MLCETLVFILTIWKLYEDWLCVSPFTCGTQITADIPLRMGSFRSSCHSCLVTKRSCFSSRKHSNFWMCGQHKIHKKISLNLSALSENRKKNQGIFLQNNEPQKWVRHQYTKLGKRKAAGREKVTKREVSLFPLTPESSAQWLWQSRVIGVFHYKVCVQSIYWLVLWQM